MKKEKLEKYIVEFNELSEQIKKDPTNEALVENFKEELFDLNSDYIEGITDSLKEDYHNFKLLVNIISDDRCIRLQNYGAIADITYVLYELSDEYVIDFVKQFEGNYEVLSSNYGLSNFLLDDPQLLSSYLDYCDDTTKEATYFLLDEGKFKYDLLDDFEYKKNLRDRLDSFANTNRDSLNSFIKSVYALSDPCHYAMTANIIDKVDFSYEAIEEILISSLNDKYEDTALAQHIMDKYLLDDMSVSNLADSIFHNLNEEGGEKFVRVLEDLNINILTEEFDYDETRDQLISLCGKHRTKELIKDF